MIIIVVLEVLALILLSAICSGLNIAVMSLDLGDLKRKADLGNKQAKKVLPLRQRPHLTLASILLTNVAAISATSLVLSQRLNGWISGLLATILIVIFGEVIPQALFLKNALVLSSIFAPFLNFISGLTYLLSRPLELLLNNLFPITKNKLQTRQELGLIIREHLSDETSELDQNEIEIMRGALFLSEKRVRDIMTNIQHTFWLEPTTKLDDEMIDQMKSKGFSRIPVFNNSFNECYGILLMKDLVDIDFDDNNYLVKDMKIHKVNTIGSMTALDTLFKKFIVSSIHLMPVEKDGQITGIVTIEDLTEEIFGQEIEDETDKIKKLIKTN
ncbi:MAG TPA: CNNM domain-containing protein [Patescibacteria group bacterium]|nr:CNNM domain-containing protein [Patescibacteria group bacterium]